MAVRIIYIIVILLFIYAALSHCKEVKVINADGEVIRCGRLLPKLINSLCFEDVILEYNDDVEDSSTNRERRDATEHRRRLKRQIASQCCERPCTIAEIMRYCAPRGLV